MAPNDDIHPDHRMIPLEEGIEHDLRQEFDGSSLDSPRKRTRRSDERKGVSAIKNYFLRSMKNRKKKTPSWNQIWRILLGSVMILAILTFLGFLAEGTEIQGAFTKAFNWMKGLPKGVSGALISLMYATSLLFFCPGTPFNLASGFIFGLWGGFAVAIVGCVGGATVAFILGRTLAKDWIANKIEGNERLLPIFYALKKNGLYIVLLTRLSPLFPFPLLNYAFGIAPLENWQYVVGTLIGSAPSTFAYCYLGTLMRDLTEMWSSTSDSNTIWLISIGAAMSLVSIVVITLVTQRAIKRATREYELLGQDIQLNSIEVQTQAERVV